MHVSVSYKHSAGAFRPSTQPPVLLTVSPLGAFLAFAFRLSNGDGIYESVPMALFANPRNRRWPQPFDQPPPATARWAASLPDGVKPMALLQRFPRIATTLARWWDDDERLQIYLDDLLVDRRGGRRGFPPDIHYELLILSEYCDGRFLAESS